MEHDDQPTTPVSDLLGVQTDLPCTPVPAFLDKFGLTAGDMADRPGLHLPPL